MFSNKGKTGSTTEKGGFHHRGGNPGSTTEEGNPGSITEKGS
jgi:hypothetical protein